ncbi:serine hydrolase [Streptantibioticus parmotrematis]|uniref:serine hydrolase n=1 Tax=Streptantibioticus parmotrematis TaxID=2873249 RepID=UPI0033E1EDA1
MTSCAPPSARQTIAALRQIFDDAGVEGFVHARDLDTGAEIGLRADERVIVASLRKIPVALAYARRAASGQLDRSARHTVTDANREGGGIGADSCLHDVGMSTRDLAFFMLSMSDNAATDKLMEIVGTQAVRTAARDVGCPDLPVGRWRELWDPVWEELGIDPEGDLDAQLADVGDERIRDLAMLDPTRSGFATPRQVTGMLAAIWHDEAGTPQACAEVRELMHHQLSQHRLVAAFEDGVTVSAKNGSLWGVLNETAVVEFPDGGRYAVAVFLRTPGLHGRQPRADQAITRAARCAVDHLRATPAPARRPHVTAPAAVTSSGLDHQLERIFADARAEGFVHALDLTDGTQVGHRADTPVVLASVFKIPIALEYARQAATGELDRAARRTVTADYRMGGSATAGCGDDVEMSVRDLAFMMMTISDNAATDLLLDAVGQDRVRATLRALGLPGFGVRSCRSLDDDIRRDLGLAPGSSIDDQLDHVTEADLLALSTHDPAHAPSATPREVTTLLRAIWRDEAAPAEACAEVRSLMAQQVWQHRLSAGFGPEVTVAGKTGTEFAVRNEAGVVTCPDGRRYAVGVFLRTASTATRQPAADQAIGRAAHATIRWLRS